MLERHAAWLDTRACSVSGRPWIAITLIIITMQLSRLSYAGIITQESCLLENLRISCPGNQVISLTSAEYGRKEVGRCITEQDDFMGCTNDVLPLLDRWCSGRRQCEVAVPNVDLQAANENCLKILTMYLKVSYTCIAVYSSNKRCSSGSKNTITTPEGTLSSHVTDETGCGSVRSPWIIRANQGQTISLNLVDFSADTSASGLVSCRRVYGFIIEKPLGINHTICGDNTRVKELYTSKTNSVELHLVPSSMRVRDSQFLLQFKAIGCHDLEHPEHAWYRREGNEAVIGCDNNDQEWRLTCVENSWQGSTGNCTQKLIIPVKEKQQKQSTFTFTSVVIMAGIIGGAVVLIVAVTMCGVIHLKKYRMKHERKRLELQKDYSTVDRLSYAYYRPQGNDNTLLMTDAQGQNTLVNLHGNNVGHPGQNTLISLPGQNTLVSLPGGGKVPIDLWDQALLEPAATNT